MSLACMVHGIQDCQQCAWEREASLCCPYCAADASSDEPYQDSFPDWVDDWWWG